MTLDQIAQVFQILGVLVVAGTLIYLSIQVRQGSDLLRSEARQAQVTFDQTNILQFIEYPELARLMSSEETPSFEEKTRLFFWIILTMRTGEHEWMQYQSGNLDEETWLGYRAVIGFALCTERNRNLWAVCSPNFHSDFVAMVTKYVKENPPFNLWPLIEEVK
jgi:hypothetical protein